MEMNLAELIQNVGVLGAMVVFLIWISAKRMQTLEKSTDDRSREMMLRMNTIEDYQRNRLDGLSERCAIAVEKNSVVVAENSRTMRSIIKALEGRPCLAGSDLEEQKESENGGRS